MSDYRQSEEIINNLSSIISNRLIRIAYLESIFCSYQEEEELRKCKEKLETLRKLRNELETALHS